MTPDSVLKQSSEMDSILMGDYIELNDLIDPGSRSSSSANSSCLTMTSDEYFDSMALLQEIENDIKDSSVHFNLSTPLKSTEVFIRLATSGITPFLFCESTCFRFGLHVLSVCFVNSLSYNRSRLHLQRPQIVEYFQIYIQRGKEGAC
ncbi:hypothetical protein HanOQP8_Chr02g0048691 [Helianthus annuus]|nr:hypothetical protein HanOQP8_Chr02g0048691 [Helianthus annuus]